MTQTRIRTRLSPAARQDQLLDTTRALITESGLHAFTMEGLAQAADSFCTPGLQLLPHAPSAVTNPAEREYQRFVEEFVTAVKDANTFEDIVRVSVATNFDHQAPGRDPAVTAVATGNRRSHTR